MNIIEPWASGFLVQLVSKLAYPLVHLNPSVSCIYLSLNLYEDFLSLILYLSCNLCELNSSVGIT